MKLRWILNRWRLKLALALGLLVLGTTSIWLNHDYVAASTRDQIFQEVGDCPQAPIALLLGVAKYSGKNFNHFYWPRVRAAAELCLQRRVRGILISGDNGRSNYNEPQEMKEDLIDLGIPEEHLTCDFAGFRTLDSIVRAKAVFGQDEFVVISQRFHCERALFLANHLGCRAWGFEANAVTGHWGAKAKRREVLARGKATLDLLIGTKPKYLGAEVFVPLRSE
ncbi:MAG: SanA protein [Planctomycetota bacterium]|jgi:SanA protein